MVSAEGFSLIKAYFEGGNAVNKSVTEIAQVITVIDQSARSEEPKTITEILNGLEDSNK